MSVSTAEISDTVKPKSSRRRKIWTSIGLIFLALTCIFIIIVIILWDRRYAIAERYAQNILMEQGVEASLSIRHLTRESIVLEDIKLTYQNEKVPFFEAKRIEADYRLKEAMRGQMKRLRFVEPKASITLDKNFRIIDGWLPPQQTDSSTGFSIPENGIFLEDAGFSLTTPYGSPEIAVTADIFKTDLFQATVLINPALLNYQSWETSGSARLDLNVKGNDKDIDALIRLDVLSGKGPNLVDATLEVDGLIIADTSLPIELSTLDMDFDGIIRGTAEKIETKAFNFKTSRFAWSGNILRDTSSETPVNMSGELDLSTDAFSFTDIRRSGEVAETVTLSEALSKTPIAQHFAPSITQSIERLMQNPSIETKLKFKFDDKGSQIDLLQPLSVSQGDNELIITRIDEAPLYVWERKKDKMKLGFDAALKLPVPMSLKKTAISAISNNGWQLQGISSFKSQIKTQKTWRVKSDGEASRLAPFVANLDYNTMQRGRRLKLNGSVDFDGRLPGGYLEGLKTSGDVDLRLPPSGQSGLRLSYYPNDSRITINSVLTDTDWRLDNIAFDLDKTNDAFILQNNKADIKADLKNLRFDATNRLDERSLSMVVNDVEAQGTFNTTSSSQNWLFNFTNAKMTSDNFPTEQTQVNVPKGQLALQRQDEIAFNFETDSLDASVPQGEVKGLKLSANGALDNYTLSHSGGRFTSDLANIPNWPLSGEAEFRDGKFLGQSTVLIPKAKNTPVRIDYLYGEGEGEAKIVLESLIFEPRRLQPQTLVPALAGKIAGVEGEVSADLNIRYKTGQPLQSDGILSIQNMNFGTAPGPVTGLNTDIQLTSLFPLQTAGRQMLTVEKFDPGFPLENGTVDYELVSNGVKIHEATWPIGAGAFTLEPFTWAYNAPENRVVMRLNEIPIEDFLNSVGNGKLEATGTVRGEFPIVIRGLNVLVDKGYLEAKDGGVIRYAASEGSAVTYSQEEALEIIRRQDTAQYRNLARDALREFTYRELTASIDGPLDGDVQLGVVFDGTNKKVLNGQPFEFDIDVQGELFNILRSFNSNAQIKSEILRKQAEQNPTP